MSTVTPIDRGAGAAAQDRHIAAETALERARAIIDLLQDVAALGGIGPPANGESFAYALAQVIDLLDEVDAAIWPEQEGS